MSSENYLGSLRMYSTSGLYILLPFFLGKPPAGLYDPSPMPIAFPCPTHRAANALPQHACFCSGGFVVAGGKIRSLSIGSRTAFVLYNNFMLPTKLYTHIHTYTLTKTDRERKSWHLSYKTLHTFITKTQHQGTEEEEGDAVEDSDDEKD